MLAHGFSALKGGEEGALRCESQYSTARTLSVGDVRSLPAHRGEAKPARPLDLLGHADRSSSNVALRRAKGAVGAETSALYRFSDSSRTSSEVREVPQLRTSGLSPVVVSPRSPRLFAVG